MKKTSTENPFDNLQLVVKLKDNFMFSELGPESIILNLDQGVYFGVSHVAEKIWKKLAASGVNGLSIAEMNSQILNEFEVTPERLQTDLSQFLKTLNEEGFLQLVNP